MDYSKYSKYKNFIENYKKATNASSGSKFDANANVENKNITTMAGELPKEDMIGLNRYLMIDKLTEMFGEEMADEYIRQLESHEIYKHDETSIYSYCVSITMYPFLFNGLKSIGGISSAPKNLQSFAGSFVNLVFAIASQFAGAVSTPEFLSYLDYFIRKEYGDDYYLHADKIVDLSSKQRTIDNVITDIFQQVGYSLNQPAAARSYQSVFWNIAYFDRPYFMGMFENFVFPDGTEMKWESVNWLQKRFMKWLNHERTINILTFPVETVNLLNDKNGYVDKEWEDFTAEMFAEGHSFFVYRSDSVDSLASCCFDGKQKVLIEVDGQQKICSFEELIPNETYLTYILGEWVKAKAIKLPHKRMYEVKPIGMEPMLVTCDHLFLATTGCKKAEDLTSNDYLTLDMTLDYTAGAGMMAVGVEYSKPRDIHPDYVYCFEMENSDCPYFTLPNGIITHNCRLRNEMQDNAFSYTLGAGGVSTGSKGVITININRLVQNATRAGKDISEAVKEQVEKVHKYLLAYNEIVKDNFKAGLLTVYNAGYIALEKQYLTIGM